MRRITDFLNTTKSEQDLATTLDVLREFKRCDSPLDYRDPTIRDFEEFLEHLVEGKQLSERTVASLSDAARQDAERASVLSKDPLVEEILSVWWGEKWITTPNEFPVW